MNEANVYTGDWTTVEDMLNEFSIVESEIDGFEVIVARYDQEGYEGSAYVLLRKEGTYYEVHGSHCSCYGLEGQWSPEATDPAALKYRHENGGSWGADGASQAALVEHFGWKQ